MYGFLQTFANNIMDWLLNPHSFHLRFEVETFRLLKCLNISERIEAKIDLDLFIDEIFMFSRFCLFEWMLCRLAKVNQEKNALIGENNYEREFSTLMKSRYDDLKSKFDQ